MADAIQKRDIVDVDLNNGVIHRSWLNHTIGREDNNANCFGIRAFRDGSPVNLSGASIQGFFRDPQGNNIAITSGNYVGGNEAYVVLPQACYNYEGQFTLAIKIINSGVTETIRIVDGMVSNTNTSGAVAPTETVPTYQEILAVYDQMEVATEHAESIVDSLGFMFKTEIDASKGFNLIENCPLDSGKTYLFTNNSESVYFGSIWVVLNGANVALIHEDYIAPGETVEVLSTASGDSIRIYTNNAGDVGLTIIEQGSALEGIYDELAERHKDFLVASFTGCDKRYADGVSLRKEGTFNHTIEPSENGLCRITTGYQSNSSNAFLSVTIPLGTYADIKNRVLYIYNDHVPQNETFYGKITVDNEFTQNTGTMVNASIDGGSVFVDVGKSGWTDGEPADSDSVYFCMILQWYRVNVPSAVRNVGVLRVSENIVNVTEGAKLPILILGDSQTQRTGYPQRLISDLTGGYSVSHFGMGGASSYGIGYLYNSLGFYVKPVTIPATATAVEVEPFGDFTGDDVGAFGLQSMQGVNTCVIDGIPGDLSVTYDSGFTNIHYYFTRANPGSQKQITRPAILETKASKRTGNTLVVWVGTNDSYGQTDAEALAGRLGDVVDTMIRKNGTDQYIVMGLTSKDYMTDYADVNRLMARKFGYHFLDLASYILQYGLSDAGITPTSGDQADIASGEMPRSLRADAVHFNASGYNVIGDLLYRRGVELGYWV